MHSVLLGVEGWICYIHMVLKRLDWSFTVVCPLEHCPLNHQNLDVHKNKPINSMLKEARKGFIVMCVYCNAKPL